jgi:hypothetical protein
MTGKADFSAEEWEAVLEGPTSAGLIVSSAQRGGTFREVMAMAKAFAEARQEHGESQLLDEIVSDKPKLDKSKAHSPEELREHGLARIREAVALVEQKATVVELGEYRNFVISLANRVAVAKKDGDGESPSEAESAAIAEISQALGV